jgi:hypothetical protein
MERAARPRTEFLIIAWPSWIACSLNPDPRSTRRKGPGQADTREQGGESIAARDDIRIVMVCRSRRFPRVVARPPPVWPEPVPRIRRLTVWSPCSQRRRGATHPPGTLGSGELESFPCQGQIRDCAMAISIMERPKK